MTGFESYPEEVARWLGERMGGEPVRFETVAAGDEQVLEERAQRELTRFGRSWH